MKPFGGIFITACFVQVVINYKTLAATEPYALKKNYCGIIVVGMVLQLTKMTTLLA